MLATEFGVLHNSCPGEMEWRRSLPPTATQAEAYLACQQGDWLLWQLERLPKDQYVEIRPAIERALDRIVTRAIRRGLKATEGVEAPWATEWRRWAERWLNGEDRSADSAWAAVLASRAAWAASATARAAAALSAWASGEAWAWAAESVAAGEAAVWASWAWAAAEGEVAWAAELRLQAEDIRNEIPMWPGK